MELQTKIHFFFCTNIIFSHAQSFVSIVFDRNYTDFAGIPNYYHKKSNKIQAKRVIKLK